MKYLLAVAISILAGGVAGGVEIQPQQVDPRLLSVVSSGTTRLLVFHLCSPEHCWTESYIQWFTDDQPSKILASEKIEELSVGVILNDVRVEWDSGKQKYVARASPSHGGFEPYDVRIYPKEAGVYSVENEK